MNLVVSKTSVAASYERARRENIDHEQALMTIAQILGCDAAELEDAVATKRAELDTELREAANA